jgi:superfamily II DNA or RNA helicase
MYLKPKHIDLLVNAGIPVSALFNSFDGVTIERGLAYFDQGKVLELRAEQDGIGNTKVLGKVDGNGKSPYITVIQYNSKKPDWISGTCTCPVAIYCKHSVAALFAYLEEKKANPSPTSHASTTTARLATTPSPVEKWLQGLQTAGLTPPVEPVAAEKPRNELIYLLHIADTRTRSLMLSLYKAPRLKKGGYGKLSHLQFEHLLNPYRPRNFHTEALDLTIAQLLAGSSDFGYHTDFRLQGETGELVLERILQTGRAFWSPPRQWQGTEAPLANGEPRPLQFRWKKSKGTYQIEPQITPSAYTYFWLHEKPHYVCLVQRQCGLLEHEALTPAQIRQMLDAPPIPETEAEAVSEQLLDILPAADIATPATCERFQVEEIHHELLPELTLKAVDVPELGRTIHSASLQFCYGEHKLQPAAPAAASLLKVDGKRYRIHRDRAGEQEALDTLRDYGFEPALQRFASLQTLDMLMQAESKTLAALRWHDFLDHGVATLRQDGWDVTIDDNFSLQFDVVDDLDAAWEESDAGNDWFEVSLGFEIEGQRINLLPILVEMLAQMESPQALKALLQRQEYILVPLSDNRWAKLESKRLESIMETLVELYDHQPLNADGNLEFSRFQGANLAALLNAPGMKWKGAEELLALTEKLKDFSGIQPVPLPENLNAELRPYQHEGLNWLQFLREFQFNGTLADDMGLGKTLQALTHLLLEKQSGRMDLPSIVIAPTSLMGNWRREAAKFTPDLRVQVVHGSDRQRYFNSFGEYDLILTTYPLMLRDEEQYLKHTFHYLILDEAQAIKNAASKTTQVIYNLKAHHRLCLTGTPLENHLGELWSMYHFLMPGFLGTHEKFTRLFRSPIEKQGDVGRQQQLRNRVQPFMLRRTKELVASELPPKSEIIRSVILDGKQRDLYETVRLAMDKKVQEEISKKGFARSQIMILDALLKLRQVCCDPRLVKLDKAQKVKQSAKLELLMTLLPEMIEEGRKVLLFSQFTSMLALIEEELESANIPYTKLTGQTKNRDEAVAAFQEGDAKVFLISLKAGGTGLNLTAADTVIHYDPWWNPAVEQQATDRAYRIGQDKPVFVYKLVTEDTVEEKILKLQERKQALADGLYSDRGAEDGAKFSAEDLMDLLKPLEK